MTADPKELKKRWSVKNEDADFPEEGDVVDEFTAQGTADAEAHQVFTTAFGESDRVMSMSLDTSKSLESTLKELRNSFAPSVIIVNHEKRFNIDTVVANLAIKYNMLYISVYQLIKQHIQGNTSWGKLLCEKRRPREITIPNISDEFEECEYSAVHFDQQLVMDLINHTVSENRTNQKYIVLEGVCNSLKLKDQMDRMEIRLQDELNMIEGCVGTIQAIIGLQFVYEPESFDTSKAEKIVFDAPVEEVKQAPKLDDDGNPIEEAAPEDPDAPKKEVFKPEAYEWTTTNNCPRNLPQCYINSKGAMRVNFDQKPSSAISSSMDEAVRAGLDEFVQHVYSKSEEDMDKGKPFCYRQIIFE